MKYKTHEVDYSHFYTPVQLAIKLIRLIPRNDFKTIIDINCGNGALLKAAASIFKEADLYGIDINNNDFYKDLNHCKFNCCDAFEYGNKCHKKYDLVLSNPPFGKTDRSSSVSYPIKELNRKRIECQMLNVNLKLLENNGWLLIILPATIVDGDSFINVRKSISKKYYVYSIINLPDDTFGSRRISTYAIILNNSSERSTTTLLSVNKVKKEWHFSQKDTCSYERILDGEWWSSGKQHIQIKNLYISRGNISSSEFVKDGMPVFHCGSIHNGKWSPTIRYVNVGSLKKENKKYADKGDVIINRIGRYAGYWWINTIDSYPVSDCLFVMKNNDCKWDFLDNYSYNGRLNISLRGVATKYITKTDILNLLVNK